MSVGIVKYYDPAKGFGFITPEEDGPEIFVHHTAIQQGHRQLYKNARVAFDIAQGPRGPQAVRVSLA